MSYIRTHALNNAIRVLTKQLFIKPTISVSLLTKSLLSVFLSAALHCLIIYWLNTHSSALSLNYPHEIFRASHQRNADSNLDLPNAKQTEFLEQRSAEFSADFSEEHPTQKVFLSSVKKTAKAKTEVELSAASLGVPSMEEEARLSGILALRRMQ